MRLLLTRPREDSEALAAQLAGSGHEAVVEPLMRIAYETAELSYDGVQALLVTSSNGVRALLHQKPPERVFQTALLAVGDATARTALQAGFRNVHRAGGDVDSLVALAAGFADPGKGPLIHVSGHDRAGDLRGALEKLGFSVETIALYKAAAADALSDSTARRIRSGDIDAVLLYSPRTAEIYCSLIRRQGLEAAAARLSYFCLSEAIGRVIAGAFDGAVVKIAQEPSQAALLALLK